MSTRVDLVRRPVTPCKVLVVDDDRRVRELLEIALTSNGFGVISAADGEEGLLRAQRERPDLVLLDVRLPKRSGLEVCDVLRNDPLDPSIPIILISALAESDHRLQGFLRGADDYLAKPFSPKELVARVRRLLARATETRNAVRRALELEREIASVKREARRAGEDARREEGLRDVADTAGRDLLALLDLDALLERLLGLVHVPLRAATTAVLVRDRAGTELVARAIRGDGFERIASLRLERDSALGSVLAGLGRPVLRADLERLRDLDGELAPLVTGHWDLVVPLGGAFGLEGALLVELGTGAAPLDIESRDRLAVLASCAAVALRNSGEMRRQAALMIEGAARASGIPAATLSAIEDARGLLAELARSLALEPARRDAAHWALELEPALAPEPRREAIETLAGIDASGLLRNALRLLDAARDAEPSLAGRVLRALLEYRDARARGVDTADAAERAAAAVASADDYVAECIIEASRRR